MGAVVEQHPGEKAITSQFGELLKAAEIGGMTTGRRLDFNSYQLTPAVLQDKIDLGFGCSPKGEMRNSSWQKINKLPKMTF